MKSKSRGGVERSEIYEERKRKEITSQQDDDFMTPIYSFGREKKVINRRE